MNVILLRKMEKKGDPQTNPKGYAVLSLRRKMAQIVLEASPRFAPKRISKYRIVYSFRTVMNLHKRQQN